MGLRGMAPSPSTFRDRVLAGAERHGLLVTWTSLSDDAATIVVRREGTPSHVLTIFSICDTSCVTDTGSVMVAADVVDRLRRMLERRGRRCL
jgi:hypothetical protein